MSELTELSLTGGVLDLRPSKDSVISQLRPNPVPAFQVANPFASMYTGCCNNNVAI